MGQKLIMTFMLGFAVANPAFATEVTADDATMLNANGLTGLRRVTSAETPSTLRLSVQGTAAGSFIFDDVFSVPGSTILNRNALQMTLGLFRSAEIGIHATPGLTYSTSTDALEPFILSPSWGLSGKLSLLGAVSEYVFSLPVDIALVGSVSLPTAYDSLFLPDVLNINARAALAFTLDLARPYDIPLRAHINGGYQYQNVTRFVDDGSQGEYFLRGTNHLRALSNDLWWYDRGFVAGGIELPFPYATPFVEVSWQSALNVPALRGANGADYSFLTDAHTTVTPGVRVGPFAGVSIELFADIGATGTAGYLAPSFAQVVDGQANNPLYMVGASLSFSLDFLSRQESTDDQKVEPKPEVEVSEPVMRTVYVCVVDENHAPLSDIAVSSGSNTGTTDGDGCTDVTIDAKEGAFSVSTKGYVEKTVSVDAKTEKYAVELEKEGPALIQLQIEVTSPEAAEGVATIWNHETLEKKEIEISDGKIVTQLVAGRYTVHVSTPKMLRTGAFVELAEEAEPAVVSLSLKKAPKRRLATRKKDEVKSTVAVPFSAKTSKFLSAAPFVLDDIVDIVLEASSPVIVVGIAAKKSESKVAQERADAVVEYFQAHGIHPSLMKTEVRFKRRSKSPVQIFLIPENEEGNTDGQ